MEYYKILAMAQEVQKQLSPHCIKCEIAGSIRRRKPEPRDIEIVAIPKPYDIGLLESGIATVVNRWKIVKGKLPCKYTQRILPQGIKLDLFFAEPNNWGLIYAIRTGSADFSHRVLARNWVRRGYKSIDGFLTKNRTPVDIYEEEDLFSIIGVPFIAPEKRNM